MFDPRWCRTLKIILRELEYFYYNMNVVADAVTHALVQKSLVGEALEHGPVAVFVVDDDGRYLAVNAYACELLGYTRTELVGLHLSDVSADPEAGANLRELRRADSRTGVTRLRRSDGTELDVHFRASQTTVGGMLVYIGTCWPVD